MHSYNSRTSAFTLVILLVLATLLSIIAVWGAFHFPMEVVLMGIPLLSICAVFLFALSRAIWIFRRQNGYWGTFGQVFQANTSTGRRGPKP